MHQSRQSRLNLVLSKMPSQPRRSHLVRRAPAPTSPLPPLHLPGSQLRRPNPNLIRRATAPISPRTSPRASPQCGQSDEEDDDEGNHEDDQEEYLNLAQKRKQGANSLRDALEEEVSRKKRKRGIVK